MTIDIYFTGRPDALTKMVKKPEYHKLLAVIKQNAKQADPDLFKFSDGSLIRLSQIEYLDVKPDVSFH